LAFATTVHPWYICPLVLLGVAGNWRFPLAWSASVLLSYAAYRVFPYSEIPALIALEYAVLTGTLLWEYKISVSPSRLLQQA